MTSWDTFASDARISFEQRPRPVPGELRPLWRVALLALVVRLAGRNDQCKLFKVRVLDWALQQRANQNLLNQFVQGVRRPDEVVYRVDPSFQRALNIAMADQILAWTDAHALTLTPRGQLLVQEVLGQEELLMEEQFFLRAVSRRLTEQRLKVLEWGA